MSVSLLIMILISLLVCRRKRLLAIIKKSEKITGEYLNKKHTTAIGKFVCLSKS